MNMCRRVIHWYVPYREVRQRKLVMAPAQDILMGQMAGREIDIQRGMAAESMRMVSPMATAEISNVHIGSQASGNRYYAAWNSDNGTMYTHYGFAIMDSNQNHS